MCAKYCVLPVSTVVSIIVSIVCPPCVHRVTTMCQLQARSLYSLSETHWLKMLGSYMRHVMLLHTLTLNRVNTTAARLARLSTYHGTDYILPQCDPSASSNLSHFTFMFCIWLLMSQLGNRLAARRRRRLKSARDSRNAGAYFFS